MPFPMHLQAHPQGIYKISIPAERPRARPLSIWLTSTVIGGLMIGIMSGVVRFFVDSPLPLAVGGIGMWGAAIALWYAAKMRGTRA